MVSSSRLESLAQRFAPYIDELHEFFGSRHVAFGTLADLQSFPSLLDDGAFREEMVSMVRSILYRESEAVPRSELMELIAIAVGGPQVSDAAEELHEPLRRILIFVSEIVRSQRMMFPPELASEDEADVAPERVVPVVSAPLNLVMPSAAEPLTPASPQSPGDLASTGLVASASTNDRLSRALSGSTPHADSTTGPATDITEAAPREPGFATATTPPPPARAAVDPSTQQPGFAATAASARHATAADTPHYEVPREASVRHAQPRTLGSFLRGAYWIPGVCALLLVLGVVWLVRPVAHPSVTAATVGPAAAPAFGAPKPSAYGPSLKGSHARTIAPATATDTTTDATSRDIVTASEVPEKPAGPPAHGVAGSASSRHSDLRVALPSAKVSPRLLGGREGVFLASSGMMAAHLLTAPAPNYPKLASLAHVEGAVIVQVVVDRDGRVEATRVLDGPRLLRGAAEHAIRHWRYRPYFIDGKPTDVATIVTVNFRLTR